MSLSSLSPLPEGERSVILARRWDGLGGRLNAIINAWALAGALDVEFRFAWPVSTSAPYAVDEVFSRDFIEAYAVPPDSFDDRATLADPTELSLRDARMALHRDGVDGFVDVAEYAATLGFRDEPHSLATQRFRDSARTIGWSPVVLETIRRIETGLSIDIDAAIHVRAGDIVKGDWRQFLPVEKYTPRALVDYAIERLHAEGAEHVVILSDNADYAAELRSRFDWVRTAQELVPGYDALTGVQKAVADIWLLSRAKQILGPTTSAFSRLAGNIAGVPVRATHDVPAADEARSRLAAAIDRDLVARLKPYQRALLTRDIAWYLAVFDDSVTLQQRLRLANAAVKLEPDFAGALNNLAFARALIDDRLCSRMASVRALAAVETNGVHADPLADSIATSIVSDVLVTARHLLRPSLWSRVIRRGAKPDHAATLGQLQAYLASYERLLPFQIHHQDVIRNLRFQLAALGWLCTLEGEPAKVAMAAMNSDPSHGALDGDWRQPGLSVMTAPGGFPMTLRLVESVSIAIAQAVGMAVNASPDGLERPHYRYVDDVYISPSGLRWINGWTYDVESPGQVAFSFAMGLGARSGGVTYLPRPDIAATFANEQARLSGFSFPVPVDAPDEFGDLQSAMRVAQHPDP